MTYLVEARNLTKDFVTKTSFWGVPKERITAVDNVSLGVGYGEILGLVGESGSGKSTLGRLMTYLIKPSSGDVLFDGQSYEYGRSCRQLQKQRRNFQIVFQDPDSALDPRWEVGRSVLEGLLAFDSGLACSKQKKVLEEALNLVGLSHKIIEKYPHELSGGQKQRLAIARALIIKPSFLVLDEVVSALDVSIQAQILNLLRDIHRSLGVTMLFISHDLAVVEYISHRVAVMWHGKIVELGPTADIVQNSQHPYTKMLFSAVPSLKGINSLGQCQKGS